MKINYHNKQFKVISNSDNGEISTDLIFHYQQHGNILTCNYNGGEIVSGHIMGIVDIDSSIHISYHQVNKNGDLKTGTCVSEPEILPNGKLKIHENWQWTSGDKAKGFSILQEI